MKKAEIHVSLALSLIIPPVARVPVAPLFLVHFFPKFSIYVRHKFNAN